jgi:hypothetical protein
MHPPQIHSAPPGLGWFWAGRGYRHGAPTELNERRVPELNGCGPSTSAPAARPGRGCVRWTRRSRNPGHSAFGFRKVAAQRRPCCGWSKRTQPRSIRAALRHPTSGNAGSADFPGCRFAGFPTGGVWCNPAGWTMPTPCRLKVGGTAGWKACATPAPAGAKLDVPTSSVRPRR